MQGIHNCSHSSTSSCWRNGSRIVEMTCRHIASSVCIKSYNSVSRMSNRCLFGLLLTYRVCPASDGRFRKAICHDSAAFPLL
jgi:hypothetical protein